VYVKDADEYKYELDATLYDIDPCFIERPDPIDVTIFCVYVKDGDVYNIECLALYDFNGITEP
jgi:hypothetical protein